MVTKAVPDDDGCVRTVFVRYSLLQKAGSSDDYSVTYKEIRVAVQRLCQIYSRKDQLRDADSRDQQ